MAARLAERPRALMTKLEPVHQQMLRAIHRRFPRPYEDVFVREDVCDTLEDLVTFGALVEHHLVWFRGYGGKDWMQGLWVITRVGAEAAGRRPPARASERESDQEPALNLRRGGKR